MRTILDLDSESERLDAEKPYGELIDGVEIRKDAPMMRHSLLQGAMLRLIENWAAGHGYAGPECRIWLDADAERPTTLVPDVAYFRAGRLEALPEREQQRPQIAPDLVVEIRSPGDPERNIARKTELYLGRGVSLVLDVDPDARSIVTHDGITVRRFEPGDVFEHEAFPGLTFDVAAFFRSGDIARA
jgi:Uma2 family endonuclease